MGDKKTLPKVKKPRVSLITRLTVRLSRKELMLLTKYLAVLLQSGLSIDDALDILLDQAKSSLKKIVGSLSQTVRSGNTLAAGMESFPHVFNKVYISLVSAGENSGTLQSNFEHLALQLQKEHELRQKIQGALMYPSIVLMTAVAVATGIVVFILPNITALFNALDVPLPITTRMLLWIGDLVHYHGLEIAASSFVAVIACLFLRTLAVVKPLTHWMTLHVPVVGTIARDTNLARITRLLGTLLASGMAISDALLISVDSLKNVHYRKLFERVRAVVTQGQTVTTALDGHPWLVPSIALRLIRVGEETGTLDNMLLYLASFYEQEVSERTKNATTLLEPLMIVMIGVLVGGLAFSIITPIYSVVSSV